MFVDIYENTCLRGLLRDPSFLMEDHVVEEYACSEVIENNVPCMSELVIECRITI